MRQRLSIQTKTGRRIAVDRGSLNYINAVMKFFLFLILFFASPAYSSDPIRLDKKLERIVKRYIKENKEYGLDRDKTVIIIRAYAETLEQTWYISATRRQDKLRGDLPIYILEVDGYTIAFCLGNNTTAYFKYPESYRKEVEQRVLSKLEETPPKRKRAIKEIVDNQQKEVIYEYDDRPLERFWHWKVTLIPGKEPVMVRVV